LNAITYVQLVRTDSNEVWLFRETEQGWKPHRKLGEIIEGEVVAESKEDMPKEIE
jgi:hypothetical protein